MAIAKKPGDGNRDRSAWEIREAQKRKASLIRTTILVAVVGVIAGVAIVRRDDLINLYNAYMNPPKPPAVVVAPPAPPPIEKPIETIKPPAPPVETKTVPPSPKIVTPPPEVVSTADQESARKLLADGKTLLDQFGYEKAQKLFGEAAAKQIGSVMKKEALHWEKKAEAFNLATRHVSIADFASADTSYIIQTYSGEEWRGLKKSEDAEQFMLQAVPLDNPAAGGKAFFPIPQNEIAKRTPVSLDQRKSEFRELLKGLESNVAIGKSADFYDLVYLSKRLALGHECCVYLTRAFDGEPGHPPDPYLGDSFRKEVVRRGIDRAAMMLASGRRRVANDELDRLLKTLPGFQVAADEVEAFRVQIMAKVKDDFHSTLVEVKKPVMAKVTGKIASAPPEKLSPRQITEEQPDFVVENKGVQGNGAAAAIVDQANEKYTEGMKLFRGFRLGTNGNNNQILRDAESYLTQAVTLYEQAIKVDPSNKTISDRQVEANMAIYSCHKYQTL